MSEESAEKRLASAMELQENYSKVHSWGTECARFRELIENLLTTSANGEFNAFIFAFIYLLVFYVISLNCRFI